MSPRCHGNFLPWQHLVTLCPGIAMNNIAWWTAVLSQDRRSKSFLSPPPPHHRPPLSPTVMWQDGSYKEGSPLRWYCSLVIKCKHCRPFILIDSSQSTIKVIYLERVIYVYVWGGRGPLSCRSRCRCSYLKRKASQVSFIDLVGETRDMQPHAQRRYI